MTGDPDKAAGGPGEAAPGAAPEGRDELDHIADEIAGRLRRGEEPDIAELTVRFPGQAEAIGRILPALRAVEGGEPPATAAPPAPALSFPGFVILEEIAPGQGGMGRVFRARDTSLDRQVAIKIVRQRLRTPEGRELFAREARSAALLDHPNIVPILSFNADHDPPFYVMPFIDGRPLDQALRGRDAATIARTFAALAQAMDHAHRKGIVHRDLKPANVLVDAAGAPHITDFGLAKLVTEAPGGADSLEFTTVKGTPRFIAPEVYADARASGPAADIYALGVCLYVSLTGRFPFPGETLEEIRASVLAGDMALPREVDSTVPEALQRICLRAMELSPRDRYATARALAADLDRFLDDREVLARPRRYQIELSGRLRNHLADIHAWHEDEILGVNEMDRLARPYRRLLDDDSPWRELGRRFPWESVLLRLGGWLVLLSSLLWPLHYWDRLDHTQRMLAAGIPTLLVNLVGWIQYARRSRINTAIFLSTGALLLPLCLAVLLTELHLVENHAGPDLELFGMEPHVEDPVLGGHGHCVEFQPTNVQILASFGGFVAYAVILLAAARTRLFAALTGTGICLVALAGLLVLGIRSWIETDRLWQAPLLLIPVAFAFVPAAAALRRIAEGRLASIIHGFFPPSLAVALTLLAILGGHEILLGRRGYGIDFEEGPIQLWIMANALAWLPAAVITARSRHGYARFWSPFFTALVSASLLLPTYVRFDRSPFLFAVGTADLTLWEILAAVFGTALVAAGTKLLRTTLTVPGLVGIAVFILRATDRHFSDLVGWPLGIGILGAAAMTTAVVALLARRQRVEPSGPTPPRAPG